MQATDTSTMDLAAAEIRLPPPAAAAAAAAAAVRRPLAYTPPGGHPLIRAEVARHLGTHGPRPATAEEVVLTAGATSALAAVVAATVPVGGVVLVPDPGLPQYRRTIELLGRRVASYPAPQDDDRWYESVRRQAPDATAVVWNDPHNPTGRIATPAEARRVADLAGRHGLFLVSDEVFADLAWPQAVHSPLPWCDPQRSAGVWSASKSLRLAGLRLGWLAAAPAVASRVARAAWDLTMSVSGPGQLALGAALRRYEATVAESRAHLERNFMVLADAGLPRPAAGTCLWVDVSRSVHDDAVLSRVLLQEYGVKVWPGSRFGPGGAGFLRVNAGMTADEAPAAAEALATLLHRYAGVRHGG
jgi:aspartate/methionine/tyrosine aminotransferase